MLTSSNSRVMLYEESIPLTAFMVGPIGFYKHVQMPFGLMNAPAAFQRLMESCLGDLHLHWCLISLDDVIIFLKHQLNMLVTWGESLKKSLRLDSNLSLVNVASSKLGSPT